MSLSEPLSEADHVLGPSSASITVVEYADFISEESRQLYWSLKEAVRWYGKLLRFAFRHFPSTPDDVACEAAEAAAAQGCFWRMHDWLFEQENPITLPQLLQFAEALKLDIARFRKDIETRAFRHRIERDRQIGILAGVLRAPAVSINGILRPDVNGSIDVVETLHEEFNAIGAP